MIIGRIATVLLFFIFVFFSCEKSDPLDPKDPSNPTNALNIAEQAHKALEKVLYSMINSPRRYNTLMDIDFTKPFQLYKQAYSEDPNNLDANFGLALLNILMLSQDEQVNQVFNDWKSYLDTNNPFEAPLGNQSPGPLRIGLPTSSHFFHIPEQTIGKAVIAVQQMAFQNAPKLSGIQKIIKNKLLPTVNAALSKLDKVDDYPYYRFIVSAKMQGDPLEDPVEIDLTEIYAMQVGLYGLKTIADIFLSYNIDFTNYDSLGILNALAPGSSFLTLQDGGAFLKRAKQAFLAGADKMKTGIVFLKNEKDYQGDDVIKLDRRGTGRNGSTQVELDSMLKDIDKVRKMLTGNYTFLGDWDNDPMTPQEELTMNIGKFFDNPIRDFKELLPAYTVTVGRDTIGYNYVFHPRKQENVIDSVTIQKTGFYRFTRFYEWYASSGEYSYTNTTLNIPKFDEAFDSTKAILMAIKRDTSDVDYIRVEINWHQYLLAGKHGVSALLSGTYSQTIPQMAIFVPIITWEAQTVNEWILPNPVLNGILPGMTDSEFKRIFGINVQTWKKSLNFAGN